MGRQIREGVGQKESPPPPLHMKCHWTEILPSTEPQHSPSDPSPPFHRNVPASTSARGASLGKLSKL